MTGMPRAAAGVAAWIRVLPGWLAAGWATIWTVGLLAPALGAASSTARPALVLVALVTMGACFGATVVGALRSPRRGGVWAWTSVTVQLLVAAALATVPGLPWMTLPLMVVVSVALYVDLGTAVVLVPVVAVLGAVVQQARGETWSDALWETGLLVALAGYLTLALSWLGSLVGELDRTRHQLAYVAVAQERVRFSRDLHDLLGHTLSVIVVKAQAARRSAPVDVEATVRHTADIEQIGRDALTQVREAVRGYRCESWHDALAGAVATLSKVDLETQVVGAGSVLDHRQAEVFGWVVREGTTNILRHAAARRVTFWLTVDRGVATLVVRDDGNGGWLPTRDGMGLTGLRERVAVLGGSLSANGDGRGFTLTATVPTTVAGSAYPDADDRMSSASVPGDRTP